MIIVINYISNSYQSNYQQSSSTITVHDTIHTQYIYQTFTNVNALIMLKTIIINDFKSKSLNVLDNCNRKTYIHTELNYLFITQQFS